MTSSDGATCFGFLVLFVLLLLIGPWVVQVAWNDVIAAKWSLPQRLSWWEAFLIVTACRTLFASHSAAGKAKS